MTQIIQVSNLELHEVHEQFNLQPTWDQQFFLEWQRELPETTDYEKHWLDQVKADFLSLSDRRLHEEIVKLVVLAPLLSLAGLTRFPFFPKAEEPVEISFDDEDEIIRGRIDVLILHQRLWAIVVEAKRHQLNVREGFAQALFEMMSSPNAEKPTFGFVLNGIDFQFIKLVKQNPPQYGLSRLFSLSNPGNDLYAVLGILKRLREIVLQ